MSKFNYIPSEKFKLSMSASGPTATSAIAATVDFSLLQIADPFQAHGGRSNKSAVVSSNGGPANWLLPAATVLFEPSTFGGESDASRLTVLNFGKRIADGETAEVLRQPDVVAAYLGAS